ncbi:amino acid ABC transporter permease [Bosea lathyri]|jgi:polar amino acid transport system permease protein|uniref:Amino acid ABC transporter membrane protein 1, PAAT family n=1 Tax=Bosea lathyri TaxID=1036778 RepID=A0A1H5YW59_9HYPH|nr:amino acid ABC transporter permease [Bosea lathyri]SEG27655.1 amino acid ABC transporter membrane protein 1, PAAT family [Bosea lathyri]
MTLDFSWLADPLYQQWLLRGLGTTILMSLLGIVLMFIIGIAGAACIHFRLPVLETLTTILVELFRNTPPLVQLFFLYFMLSEIGLTLTDSATGRSIPLFSGFTCVVLSLGLYNGAIAVEIIRSGLLAVPSQTVEGARSLGYSRLQTFRHVELPIGLRMSIPAMTNNVVSLIKTSSQAVLVAVADIMYGATQIMLETFRNLEVMILIWIIYVVIASLAVVAARRIAAAVRIPGYGM